MATERRDPSLFDPLIPLAERVSVAFETNGPLSRAVKGFRVREGQKEFALEVCRAVNEKACSWLKRGRVRVKPLPI